MSAGDNIGASPLLSGLSHDEPTIEALNAAGLDVSAVGNHEFDEGWRELLRMQGGGCHPVDGCSGTMPFGGARFQYLAANVEFDAHGTAPAALPSALPGYAIRDIGGVKIGFIGMTLHDTPHMVTAEGIRGLTFADEAATAARLVPILQRQGVHTIVLLIHQGGAQADETDIDECRSFSGAIVDVVTKLPDDIGVVVSGHTHRAYNCTIAGRLVTSAASYGRVITAIDLSIEPDGGRLISKSAHNVVVTRDVPRDTKVSDILERFRPRYEVLAHRVIGRIAGTIPRRANGSGESPLGDLLADAQLEQARRTVGKDVAVAFMNPGGMRADLVAGSGSSSEVTYEQAYAVQPFGNRVVVKTMTGEMIRRLLEQQFTRDGRPRLMLQVSDGSSYAYDLRKPPGQRVNLQTLAIGGAVVRSDVSYRVAMNGFLADGGDGFSVFTEGVQPADAGVDLAALEQYFAARPLVSPPTASRMTRTDQ